jgi:gas vesicle protein
MDRGSKVFAGFVLGALCGVTLVLLFAPRSGADTQQLIRDRVQGILDEGRQAAEDRRLELTERFETLKQPGPMV